MTLLKSLAWVVAGGAGGAIGTALLLDGDEGAAATAAGPASFVASVADFALGRDSDARTNTVAERFDVYREAQQESDPEALARSLGRAAARTWSPSRDVEIDALLGRLIELSPEYAAALAESLLDPSFVAQAYVVWAEADPDAALSALARIPNTAVRRVVSLALTDVFGDDARGVDRIGAVLASSDRDALQVAWIAERASTDPFGAFREAASYGDTAHARRALEEVAISWAAEDPLGALAQAELLPRNLVQIFRARVFAEWARLDAEGFAAHVESQASFPSEAATGLQYLLVANPELVERIADNLPADAMQQIRTMSLQAKAARDPEAAKAEAVALPPGQLREQAITAVAGTIARTDPREAVDWIRGLSPPPTNAMASVMSVIAQTDINAALELLEDPLMAANSQLSLVLMTTSITDPAQAPLIAERLAGRTDAESQAALSRLVTSWMGRDPESAFDWVLERGADVDPAVLASAAQSLAARDPVKAASYVDRIPQAQRSNWIVQVATGYGRADPQGAMFWVTQFQGQEFYDTAVRQLISSAAQTDPFVAAQLLRQSSPTVQFGAAQQVASAMAQRDPLGAFNWAQTLADPRARSSAQVAAATAWFVVDAPNAQRHVLAMPAGADRDQLLTNFFQRSASTGMFDREFLNAISNQATRQQLAGAAIANIARTDVAQARALLDSEITDPVIRERVGAQINEISSQQ